MEKSEKKKKIVGFVIGNMSIMIGVLLFLPRFIDAVSSGLYKHSKKDNIDNDDWGPVIEKIKK